MVAYHKPGEAGYPTSNQSISFAFNAQDVSVDLNSTTEAELLIMNALEDMGDGIRVDAFLGT